MATNNWNSSYENSPADGDNISEGASKIRGLKQDIRERIAKDHYMDVAGTQADHGEHSKVTFNAPIITPANVANKGFLYTKDVGGKAELHWVDEDNHEVQLTSIGNIAVFPSGTKTVFFQASAPTGWTQDTSLNDYMLRLVSGIGGGHGGTDTPILNNKVAAHTHGTDNPGNHTHTNHVVPTVGAAEVFGLAGQWPNIGSQNSSYSGSHTHTTNSQSPTASNWTPKYANMILCTKN